ncbi:MAG TPA: ribonuclease H-like domain-containing protein [Patescibacteria group bacterium]|jgi:DEAD/DEAH box helicase domain-containing protein|nr:ribonuclease H-like domain-containing protein [Patescibacteria group bacterium]
MAANKIVLDLETQKSFDEVGGRDKNHLLKVSVVGVYSYQKDQFLCFAEDQMYRLQELLASADQIIGFNIKNFDYQVLQPYLSFNLNEIPTLDILQEVEKIIGHRVKLDNLAQMTLGTGKSGDGLEALKLYKQGRMDDLKKYCLDDVRITRDLYDYVSKYSKLLFKDYFETKEIQIHFNEPEIRKPLIRQTALF